MKKLLPSSGGPVVGRATACLWMACAFASCETPTGISKFGIESYEALPEYVEFWAATEACSGMSGELELIRWFRASSMQAGRQIVRGLWERPHDITVLIGLEDDERTVRHEMLHDLLRGDPNHGLPAWEACDLEPQ